MRMVPRTPVLRRLPRVRLRLPWRRRALGDRHHTILVVRVELPHAMPVNARPVVRSGQVVGYVDGYGVAPGGVDGGAGD